MLVHKFLLVVEFPDNMKHIMHSCYKCSVGTNINIVIYVFWGEIVPTKLNLFKVAFLSHIVPKSEVNKSELNDGLNEVFCNKEYCKDTKGFIWH